VKILWSLVSGPNKGKFLGACDELSFEMQFLHKKSCLSMWLILPQKKM
jgi:hypothetical protein